MKCNPIVRAWVEAKAVRQGDRAMKAIVALMRKLVTALPHLARGSASTRPSSSMSSG